MLTTPILLQKVAFDATQPQVFDFSVVGGNQVTQNRLWVRDNSTLATVYDQTQTTFVLAHTLPANTLTNGGNYIAQVQTFDASANASLLSNTIQFYCFTTPTIAFTNIPVGNVIGNNNFTFDVTYDQAQDEILNTYIFKLYNSSQVQIATSDILYVGSATPPPTNLSYAFAGFEDNAVYYVECIGQTINGTEITTGKVQFSVNFIQPNIYAIVGLENNCDAGNITISSNIVTIEGLSNPEPPTYIADEEVDLTASGTWVKWNSGFSISDNFTMRIWGRDFTDYETILSAWNNTLIQDFNQIKLTYMKDITLNKIYVELRCVQGGNDPYYVYSNYIDEPLNTEQLFIWVRRVGNLFDLIIENKGVV